MRHWSFISAFGLFCMLLAAGPATAASTENWTQKSLPESGLAIAYDEARHEVVQVVALPSGSASTWIWQGKGWIQKFPQNSPGFDRAPWLTTRSESKSSFLRTKLPFLAPDMDLDGSNWTQKFPSSSPPAAGYLSYDPRLKRLLQFGGTDNNGNPYSQTWTWDGNDWTQLSPSHSPSGGTGVLAYDHAKQQMVFFGGFPEAGQTWLWNGSDWTQQSPHNSPPAGNGLYGGLTMQPKRQSW